MFLRMIVFLTLFKYCFDEWVIVLLLYEQIYIYETNST